MDLSGSQESCALFLAVTVISCVTLSKVLCLSVPWFPFSEVAVVISTFYNELGDLLMKPPCKG